MLPELEQRLSGTRRRHVLDELLGNSIHFPVVNIFLEMLLEGPLDYLEEPDLYTILVTSLVQAWVLGTWQFRGTPRPLLGNLIGPFFYTLVEWIIEGDKFFQAPHHWAYWGFALVLGALQQGRLGATGRRADLILLTEHWVRTNILMAAYWIFESLSKGRTILPGEFFGDGSHIFMVASLAMLGLVIGMAHISLDRALASLRQTAAQLRIYSRWLLGEELLAQAVANSHALALTRRERTVLFVDIRGFTSWSEHHPPEEVVSMLNAFFGLAEGVWRLSAPIKVKYTGDEIMAVFASARDGVITAVRLHRTGAPFLARHGLAAGMGLHRGELIEGMVGSPEVKAYDIIGDTVNTAKRICDQAGGGEILLSQAVLEQLPPGTALGEARMLTMKGKEEPLEVRPLRLQDGGAAL